MTTQDKLLVCQTIIAAVAAAVVIVYTWVTWRLQRNSQEQTNILRQQLDLAKSELAANKAKARSEAEPYISWRGGSSGIGRISCEFQNVGARIFDLELSHPPNVKGLLEPKMVLLRNGQGSVSFSSTEQLPVPLWFEIRYSTRLGEQFSKHFMLEKREVLPRETEMTAIT